MNDKNCNHKFFGSKLNTVLLLVLIALLGVTIYLIKQNKIETIFDKQILNKSIDSTGLKEYKNEVLGISFMYPTSCGSPEINKYYKHVNDGVVQGTFSANCPLRSFSSKVYGVKLDNDDDSFGAHEAVIKDSSFNFTTQDGIRGVIKYEDPNMEMGDPNTVYYTFNLNSQKYQTVTFVGSKLDNNLKDIVDSLKIY